MIYLKTIAAGMIGALLFLVFRWAALRLRSAKLGTTGAHFWVLLVLCFLAGAALYSQFRGMVFYTAHVPR